MDVIFGRHPFLKSWPWWLILLSLSKGATKRGDFRSLSCPVGTFRCDDRLRCVKQRNACDGKEDCEDGSDEHRCHDKQKDEKWNSYFYKRPDADREGESEVCVLQAFPTTCQCKNGTRLYCDNGSLTEVPGHLPSRMTVLDLSGNNIPSVLKSQLQNVSELQELIITNSHVKSLEDGIFDGCLNLKHIYLQTNELEELPNILVLGENSISFIDVSGNKLQHLQQGSLRNLKHLKELHLSANNIKEIDDGALTDLETLESLMLNQNRLTSIRRNYFKNLTKLNILNLKGNNIKFIERKAFLHLESLKSLILDHNCIKRLTAGSFDGLSKLTFLDLQNNDILHIEREAILPLKSLESLNLQHNSFQTLEIDTLQSLVQLSHVYFDRFYMCIYAIHVRDCWPKGDGISSHENLLENTILRVSTWIIGILSCCGNIIVLLKRFFAKDNNKVHSFYIQNLAIADLFVGVYLLLIGTRDLIFRGEYLNHDEKWRNSWKCDVTGILCTVSTEVSVMTLTVITLDRYISIVYPLSLRRQSLKLALGMVVCLWLICIAMATIPVTGINYFGKTFYRGNAVCIPLHIHNPIERGWQYSAFIFIGINFAAFLLISYTYVIMFCTIRQSTMSLRSTKQNQERTLVKRFFFIVITDFACWVPIIIIKLVSLGGIPVSSELYAWLAVFILPINSALNPLIYTLTTTTFKRAMTMNTCHNTCHRVCRTQPWETSSSLIQRKRVDQDTEIETISLHAFKGARLVWKTSYRRSLSYSNAFA